MKVQEKVLLVWQSLSRPERRMVRNRAKHSVDAGFRNRCKIVVSLVAGNGARAIAKPGLCSISQVYRVAERFVEHGPPGGRLISGKTMGKRRPTNGINRCCSRSLGNPRRVGMAIAVRRGPKSY